jgi:hypothetical protein
MRIAAAVLYDVNKPYSLETVELDPLAEINRAYEDIESDAVGRGVLVFS